MLADAQEHREFVERVQRGMPPGICAELSFVVPSEFGRFSCATLEEAVALRAKCDAASEVLDTLPRAQTGPSRGGPPQVLQTHPPEAVELLVTKVRGFIAAHYARGKSGPSTEDILEMFDKDPWSGALADSFRANDMITATVHRRLLSITRDGTEHSNLHRFEHLISLYRGDLARQNATGYKLAAGSPSRLELLF